MRRLLIVLFLGLLVVPAVAQGPMVPAAPVTSTVYNGTTPLLPRFKSLDRADSGSNEAIGAQSGYKIRVLAGWFTMTGTAVSIRFEDSADGAALTGQFTPASGQTIVLPFNPVGWFETSAGNTLTMELGGGQSVDGALVYVLVP